jgi:hypothetical protein
MALVQLLNRSREQIDLFTAVYLRTDRTFITRRSYYADTLPLLTVLELRMIQTVTFISLTYLIITDKNIHEL